MGSPTMDVKQFYRSAAITRRLPDMYYELNNLRKELNELKGKLK